MAIIMVGGVYMTKKVMIDSIDNNSILKIRDSLSEFILPIAKSDRPIIILCIGTDRSTGDSLGPLIGEKLKFLVRENVFLFGNLEYPVHAKNLSEFLEKIKTDFRNPYIIAVDACLGSIESVGHVIIQQKPLSPGAAMNKNLPKVGDLSITGIVNISGALDFMVLQNTRLHTVMKLADAISKGIYHSIIKTYGGKKTKNSNIV